jgi:hypothetical protein
MSDLVSREELKAMMDIQSKNVEQLTVIANHLSTIVDRENKIYERLYNGLAKDISLAVTTTMEKLSEEVTGARKEQVGMCAAASPLLKAEITACLANSTISKDIGLIKWFISIVGVLIVIASVFLNGMGRNIETSTIERVFKQTLSQVTSDQSDDLKQHMAKYHLHTGTYDAQSNKPV